jgi:hypothetical protein
MELKIQPLGAACQVSGRAFAAGDRVASFLLRSSTGEVLRHDLLESEAQAYLPAGAVVCRWVRVFKPRPGEDDPERSLKLSADNLFLALADPSVESTPETARLLQFLALLLERKRVLRPRGRTADAARNLYEHARTKQLYEVPVGALTPEFFAAIRGQLGILVGEPKAAEPPAATA